MGMQPQTINKNPYYAPTLLRTYLVLSYRYLVIHLPHYDVDIRGSEAMAAIIGRLRVRNDGFVKHNDELAERLRRLEGASSVLMSKGYERYLERWWIGFVRLIWGMVLRSERQGRLIWRDNADAHILTHYFRQVAEPFSAYNIQRFQSNASTNIN